MEDFAECKICQKTFNGPESYTDHLASKNHEKNIAKTRKKSFYTTDASTLQMDKLHCDVCNVTLSGEEPLKQHLNGSKHLAKVKNIFILSSLQVESNNLDRKDENILQCSICEKCFSGPTNLEQHVKSKKHKRKVELYTMKGVLNGELQPSCPPSENKDNEGSLYPALDQDYLIVHEALQTSKTSPSIDEKKMKNPIGCFSRIKGIFKKNKKHLKNKLP